MSFGSTTSSRTCISCELCECASMRAICAALRPGSLDSLDRACFANTVRFECVSSYFWYSVSPRFAASTAVVAMITDLAMMAKMPSALIATDDNRTRDSTARSWDERANSGRRGEERAERPTHDEWQQATCEHRIAGPRRRCDATAALPSSLLTERRRLRTALLSPQARPSCRLSPVSVCSTAPVHRLG